jgi:hypothetical protein
MYPELRNGPRGRHAPVLVPSSKPTPGHRSARIVAAFTIPTKAARPSTLKRFGSSAFVLECDQVNRKARVRVALQGVF